MSAIVHSAHPNFAVDHIFGRMNYSVMLFVADQMAQLNHKKYLDMHNSRYSNEDIKTAMAYDFVDKYSKGDHAFCQSMLDSMMLGASGYSNHTYRKKRRNAPAFRRGDTRRTLTGISLHLCSLNN